MIIEHTIDPTAFEQLLKQESIEHDITVLMDPGFNSGFVSGKYYSFFRNDGGYQNTPEWEMECAKLIEKYARFKKTSGDGNQWSDSFINERRSL